MPRSCRDRGQSSPRRIDRRRCGREEEEERGRERDERGSIELQIGIRCCIRDTFTFLFSPPSLPPPRFAARKAAAVARALLLHHYAPSLWCPLGTRVAERNAHTGLRDAELLRVFYARVFEEKRGDGWGGRAFAAKERIARGRDEKRGEGWNDRGRGGRREKRREREERELRSLRFLEGK